MARALGEDLRWGQNCQYSGLRAQLPEPWYGCAEDLELKLEAKRLGYRLKLYVDKSHPYVIILGKDVAKW